VEPDCSRSIATQMAPSSALVHCAVLVVVSFVVAFEPPMYINMPCSTMTCPVGYKLRWDATTAFCADGACKHTTATSNSTDVSTCCVQDHFSSFGWRIQVGSNVSEDWELKAVRFYLSSDCSAESLLDTSPGVHHAWRGWPNGAAFAHYGGHGAVPAPLFNLPPQAWSSGEPCEPGTCHVGYKFESDIDRYPLGACIMPNTPPRVRFGETCSSQATIIKANGIQVACAQVEQGNETGRYAEILQLQCLHTMNVTENELPDIWRTVAVLRVTQGGLAELRTGFPGAAR